MHDFSLLRIQDIHPGDVEFCEKTSIQIQEEPQFFKKIWTGKKLFCLIMQRFCFYIYDHNLTSDVYLQILRATVTDFF